MLKAKPPLIGTRYVGHRNYAYAKKLYTTHVLNAPPDKVVALIGPTQSGKSTIFCSAFEQAEGQTKGHADNLIPELGLKIEAPNDGRINSKFLNFQLLKELRHPVYQHIGAFDELSHYLPSRGRDDATLRTAVGNAMSSREVRRCFLDEAHHLTYTKDPELRNRILESLKCSMAFDRTLFLCGGYELAFNGFFDSAHFSGRLMIVELAPYTDVDDDILIVAGILKRLEEEGCLRFEKLGLLTGYARPLLIANNGSVGLIMNQLYEAQAIANSEGRKINEDILLRTMPPEAVRLKIKEDIKRGQDALKKFDPRSLDHRSNDQPEEHTEVKVTPPFQRKPQRRSTGMDHIAVESSRPDESVDE